MKDEIIWVWHAERAGQVIKPGEYELEYRALMPHHWPHVRYGPRYLLVLRVKDSVDVKHPALMALDPDTVLDLVRLRYGL
jgi:hypothetical protein